MSIGWTGEKVRLVPLDERHFELVYQWINTPEITKTLLVGDLPMTRIAEREWFERMSKGTGSDVVFVIERLDGEPIGVSGIHQIDYRHGTCVTGSYIGRVDLWGQGFGSDAARVRARYVFEVLGLRQIYSAVLEGNDRSLRMQEKAGYEVVATFPKKFWKNGQFRNEHITLLTRERWSSLNSQS